MHLVKELREQHEQGVKIFMIIRSMDEKSYSRENRRAFTYIQEKLKENYRIITYIHSRMIIRNEMNGLVSSADLIEGSLNSKKTSSITRKFCNCKTDAFIIIGNVF